MSNSTDRTVRISKLFSRILRHGLHDYPTLKMDEGGSVRLDALLALHEFHKYHISDTFVQRMVSDDSKGRFTLEDRAGHLYIRANQGHSKHVGDLLILEKILSPIQDAQEIPVLIHGTTPHAWRLIRESGLNRMRRSHIHFSTGVVGIDPTVKSGMRQTARIHIYVNVPKCMESGMKFFRSTNNVILSDGLNGSIPPEYFLKVIDHDSNTVIYP